MNCISVTNISQWNFHKYIETHHLTIDSIGLIEIVFMQSDAIHVSASFASTFPFHDISRTEMVVVIFTAAKRCLERDCC